MQNHTYQASILRPLCHATLARCALCATIFASAALLTGCGQKGDLRPVTPKPPVQISVLTSTNFN